MYMQMSDGKDDRAKIDKVLMDGIWLGIKGRTGEHIIGTEKGIVKAYTVKRRPEEERWSLDIIQCITATPWDWSPGAYEQASQPQIFPGTAQEPNSTDQPENYTGVPHPMHIAKEDLEKYGYTANCGKCMLIRNNRKNHGVRHVPECRAGIEARA